MKPGRVSDPAPEKDPWPRWLVVGLLLLSVVGVLPVVWTAYLGSLSRYLADDFCTAGTLREMGFLGSQSYWYQSWSGRFSFTFMISLTHLVGPRLTPWLPGICLALAGGALWFLAQRLARLAEIRAPWTAGILPAAACLVATLAAAPNLYQSVLWQTGLITYFVPLILLTAYVGWLLWVVSLESNGRRGALSLMVSAVIPFLAGGFSETFVSVQTTGLVVAVVVALLAARGPTRTHLARHLVCGLAGSLLALLVVALAPGNAVRQGLMPEPPGLMLLLERTWHDVYVFGARMVRGNPLSLFAPFAVAYTVTFAGMRGVESVGDSHGRGIWPWIAGTIGVSLAAFAAMAAAMAPSEYALSAYPDGRIVITAVFAVVMAAALGGYLLAGMTRQLLARKGQRALRAMSFAVAAALLLGVVAVCLRNSAGYFQDARGFAAAWDARDASIHAALARGENDIPVASLTHMAGLGEVSRDPDDWVNRCLADAYGLKRVTAK
jgi:hypothetical protein